MKHRPWMPGPDRKSGPVRINYVVRIFRSGFSWSGPWSGFFGPDFFGPVRGSDFSVRIFTGPVRRPDFLVRIIRNGPDFFVVRSVVRIFFFKIKKNPDRTNFTLKTSVRSGFRYGFSIKKNPYRINFV